jgi:hypothetical protein
MAPAITGGGRVLLLVSTICASTLCAQKPAPQTFQPVPSTAPQPAPSLLQEPAQEAKIDLGSDTLSIRADNSSLAGILHQIAAKSGMQIEGLGADERVFGSFGPGAPRDVLADLLNGTAYNVVLLGDLSDGVPRQLTLTPATHTGAATPAPAPRPNADDNDQEAEQPPPEVQQPPTPPPGAPGVRTPQQLFEQLQRMRSQQQQNNGAQDPQQQQQQQAQPQQQ